MQGGHRGSSFHNGNYFYKLVPHNRHDETHGYEILTDTQVPVQITHGSYNQNITSEVAKNMLKQQYHNNIIIPHILPVFGKFNLPEQKHVVLQMVERMLLCFQKKKSYLMLKLATKVITIHTKNKNLITIITQKIIKTVILLIPFHLILNAKLIKNTNKQKLTALKI